MAKFKKAVNLQTGRGPGKGAGVRASTKSGAPRKTGGKSAGKRGITGR